MKNNFDNNVYANEEEFVDFTNERKKCTVMSIKSNSKDITKLRFMAIFKVGKTQEALLKPKVS